MHRVSAAVLSGLLVATLPGVPAALAGSADPSATADSGPAYACRQDVHPQDPDFPGVHVATLTEAPDGDLLYGFYAGTREAADDVGTYMARLPAAANTWTKPRVIFDEPGKPDGNAVLWTDDRTGRIHLFFSTIMGDWWTDANLRRIHSDDGGRTWSEPSFIREEWGWLFGTRPFRMSNGELIVPIYDENHWTAGFYLPSDDLAVWHVAPHEQSDSWPQSLRGSIQPATIELEPGRLRAYMRSRDGLVWTTESTDYGRTWTDAQPTTLPNNNSRLDVLKLSNGNLVLAYNPTVLGRSPLRLALSTDGGESWPHSVDVESELGAEFSYPYLIEGSDGMIHLGYTHRRRSMRHLVFNEEYLRSGPDIASNPSYDVKAEYRDGELRDVEDCAYGPPLRPVAVNRLAGATRIETSVQVSQAHFTTTDTVVLARADEYADALAGAPLARGVNAPMLLTPPERLAPPVGDEVRRLGATHAILLGGEAALSEGVADDLRAAGVATVERVSGRNRFDTARAIAERVGGSQAMVARGGDPDPDRGWADAAAAAPLAAHLGVPLLLVEADRVPAETTAALDALGANHVTIVGGTAVVSDRVAAGLSERGMTVERLAGADRYGTSATVAERSLASGLGTANVWLGSGLGWADLLSSAPTAAAAGGILLLVDGRDLASSPATRDWLAQHRTGVQTLRIVGGRAAVSPEAEAQARAIVAR